MKRKLAFAVPLAFVLLLALAASPRSASASWYWKPGADYGSTAPSTPTTPPPATAPPTTPNAPTATGSWYWNRAQYIQQWYGQPQAPAQPAPTTPNIPSQPPTQPTTPPKSNTPPTTPSAGLTADEALMVSLVNQARAAAGLNPLQVDATLTQLARLKSQDILDNNYFAHTSPTYGSAFSMMKNAGVTYRIAGENLAKAKDTAWAHQRLMASDGHRANILNPDFTHIGVGIVKYQYGVVVTELFIGK